LSRVRRSREGELREAEREREREAERERERERDSERGVGEAIVCAKSWGSAVLIEGPGRGSVVDVMAAGRSRGSRVWYGTLFD
jgi:hypothetical protein